MRRTISLILITFILLNMIAPYAVFQLKQHENKERIEKLIRSELSLEQLTLLMIPEKLVSQHNFSFQRIESDEIYYKGHMYDVVREKNNHDGFIYFYCINDKTEDELMASFEKSNSTASERNYIKNISDKFSLKQPLNDIFHNNIVSPNIHFYFTFFSTCNPDTFCMKSMAGHPTILDTPPRLI